MAAYNESVERKPFCIKRDIVTIEGGCLSTPWVADVKKQRTHGGLFPTEFVELKMSNRKLARALGLDCGSRFPFSGTTLLYHLAQKRNEKVDDLIKKAKVDNDTMADKDAIVLVGNARTKGQSCTPQSTK